MFSRPAPNRSGAWLLALLVMAELGAGPAWAETATFRLRNGDKVTGEVVERRDGRVVLDHPVLGRLTIPVAEVNPASLAPGLFGTSMLEGWARELSIGLGGSQGDTDEADLGIRARLEYKGERRHWRFDARYELSFADEDIDDHNAHVTSLRDWLWPGSRWFAFAFSVYDYDDFEAWKHRLTFGGGPAYHLLAGPRFTLDTRVGPFLTYEFGDEDEARPEGALGLFAAWTIAEGHTLELLNVYYQTLDEAELRNVSDLAWKVRFDLRSALSLKVGIRNEYDSASEESKDNLRYFTAIAFDL